MDNNTSITVTKLDAARRQLDCALELWFNDGDPVSTHVLAGASYNIIHAVTRKHAPIRDLLYDSDRIKDEYRGKWINHLNRSYNFFKHADRPNEKDPNATIELSPHQTKSFLIHAVVGLADLKTELSLLQESFRLWFLLHEESPKSRRFRENLIAKEGADHLAELTALPKLEIVLAMQLIRQNKGTLNYG